MFFRDRNDEGGDEGGDLLRGAIRDGDIEDPERAAVDNGERFLGVESRVGRVHRPAPALQKPPPTSAAKEDEDEIDVVVQSIIGRIGDADVRVWTAALGTLRDLEGGVTMEQLLLMEDTMVEILGKGLTRR